MNKNKKIYIVPTVKVMACMWLDDLCDFNVGVSGTPVDGDAALGKGHVDDGVDEPASAWD